MSIGRILWGNWLCYNGIALHIEGDEQPQENPKTSAIPLDGVKEPSPSDYEKSSECQEIDFDTDFEDDVSDTEQD